MTFSPERIKRLRKEILGMTQAEFGLFVEYSRETVWMWENGVRSPSALECRALEQIEREALERRPLQPA